MEDEDVQKIVDALKAVGGASVVMPPGQEYNVSYLTVRISTELVGDPATPAEVLNALEIARLLKCAGTEPASRHAGPRLEIVGVGDYTVTLRNTAARPRGSIEPR